MRGTLLRAFRRNYWVKYMQSPNSPIIAQLDDGAGDPGTGQGERYTSSSSAPGVVAQFFELLELDEHHRVLEIGTGTGWTAALLSHRVGPDNAVTMEVDAALAETAGKNLAAAGVQPRVIVGDGAFGIPTRHLRPGPRDLRGQADPVRVGGPDPARRADRHPAHPRYGSGHKVRLDVVGDGTALGRFTGPAGS
jgi:Protein-L-isoaspartate(D-aspartate) O-methyltransferase (PCMT)